MNKTLIEEGFWSSLNISYDTQPICKDKDNIRSHSLTFIDTRPNPLKCVDTIWASSNEALLILFYIESPFIFIESFELGLAPCRFLADYKTTNIDKKTGEGKKSKEDTTTSVKSIQDNSSIFDFCITKEMGCSALTDGVYVWPEGFAHYIRRHGVKPSDQFINHILEKVKSLGMILDMNLDMNKISHGYKRLLYDPESGEGVALPAETKSYLSLHSSLIGL
jgi:hypothetical protein